MSGRRETDLTLELRRIGGRWFGEFEAIASRIARAGTPHAFVRAFGEEMESAFAKESRAHCFVCGQIGAAKDVIRNASRILGNFWHSFRSQHACFC